MCLRWRTYFCDGSKLQRLFMRLGDPDVLFRLTKEELNWRDTAVFVCYSKTLPLAATEGYGLHVLSHTYTHRPGYKLGRFFSSDFCANFKMAHMMQKQSDMCLVFDFPTFFLEFWASKRWCQACASLYLFTSPILRMAQLDSSVQCSLDLTWRRAFMCDFR